MVHPFPLGEYTKVISSSLPVETLTPHPTVQMDEFHIFPPQAFLLNSADVSLTSIIFQLKNTMVGKTTSIDDPLLQRLWTHSSNPAKAFLLSVGFDQVMEGNQKVLCLKWDFEQISLEDVYVAVFVMCTKI